MFVRQGIRLLIATGVGWWLFADTVAHYRNAAPATGVIRFAHFGSYEDYELWRDVIADFEREHPGRHVRQEYIPGVAGQYTTKMRQQILSGTLPDVALIQLAPFHELAEHFADLSDLLRASSGSALATEPFDSTALAAFRFHGAQRGLPVSGGPLLIYLNTQCFERAALHRGQPIPLPGDDWTLEDFRRTAGLLTCDFDDDGRIDQFGFWLPQWVYYLPFVWSFGAELTDETMSRWTLYGPEAEDAMTFYRGLAIGDRVCPRDDEVPQLFQDVGFLTGRVAMCVNGPWFQPFLAKTGLATSYMIAPIPLGPAGRVTRSTWDGVVIPDRLPPDRYLLAKQFVEHVTSAHAQDRIARTGRAMPARIQSLTSFAAPPDEKRRRRFIDALTYSRVQPVFPHFPDVDRAINRTLGHLSDPGRNSSVTGLLDQLTHDPAIVGAFPQPGMIQP